MTLNIAWSLVAYTRGASSYLPWNGFKRLEELFTGLSRSSAVWKGEK